MFKGYGDMDVAMSMQGSILIAVDQPLRQEPAEESKDAIVEETKERIPELSKIIIKGYEWAYQLTPMTTAEINQSNIKERDFMSMLPLEYLKKATEEQLNNGLLIQL